MNELKRELTNTANLLAEAIKKNNLKELRKIWQAAIDNKSLILQDENNFYFLTLQEEKNKIHYDVYNDLELYESWIKFFIKLIRNFNFGLTNDIVVSISGNKNGDNDEIIFTISDLKITDIEDLIKQTLNLINENIEKENL